MVELQRRGQQIQGFIESQSSFETFYYCITFRLAWAVTFRVEKSTYEASFQEVLLRGTGACTQVKSFMTKYLSFPHCGRIKHILYLLVKSLALSYGFSDKDCYLGEQSHQCRNKRNCFECPVIFPLQVTGSWRWTAPVSEVFPTTRLWIAWAKRAR